MLWVYFASSWFSTFEKIGGFCVDCQLFYWGSTIIQNSGGLFFCVGGEIG